MSTERLPGRPLAHEDIMRLVGALSPTSSVGIRNRALLMTLYRTGLRISEALGVMPRDLDLDRRRLWIPEGKGSKSRWVAFVAGDAEEHVRRWMDRRERLGINGRSPVFCQVGGSSGTRGERIDPSYLRHLMPRLARKAGVDQRAHPHALRHSHAAWLVEHHADIRDIRDQLGHARLSTTHTYLCSVAPEERISRLSGLAMEPEDTLPPLLGLS